MRDDFNQRTKDVLFKRARGKCSNPSCRKETSEAHSDENKAVNTGFAAHITAASPEGPRYDSALSVEQRTSASNGIWLCGRCAKLIDSDSPKYAIEILREWKRIAEAGDEREAARIAVYSKLEDTMSDLLSEMRQDLTNYPFKREFILMNRAWTYNSGGEMYLAYYYNDHDYLDDKVTILCNHHLVEEITYNNVKRYKFTEDFVDYLTQSR